MITNLDNHQDKIYQFEESNASDTIFNCIQKILSE